MQHCAGFFLTRGKKYWDYLIKKRARTKHNLNILITLVLVLVFLAPFSTSTHPTEASLSESRTVLVLETGRLREEAALFFGGAFSLPFFASSDSNSTSESSELSDEVLLVLGAAFFYQELRFKN